MGIILPSLCLRSYDFYKMFVPSNVPMILLPFLIVIESISYSAKVLSLAIRLFANMMSGHVLLHILTGFVLKLGKLNLLLLFFPILILIVIYFLEYGIAFLQAYVFVILLAIYFEEHFGFSLNDKAEISKLISINGRESFTIRHIHSYSIISKRLRTRKGHWFVGTYQNKRRKTRFTRNQRFWNLTVITWASITRKR